MTSANVFNLSSVGQNQTLNANAAASKNKAGNSSAAAVFSSMMDVNYSTNSNTTNNVSPSIRNEQTDRTQNPYTQYSYQERDISSAAMTDKLNAAADKLDDFDQKVVEAIAKELDVDEDAVRSAMEELGLAAFGVMNPQNLVQLVVRLTDASSSEDLLFQPQFADLMQEMQTLQNGLMSELELMPDEMQELLAQMDVVENPELVTEASFADIAQQVQEGNELKTQESEFDVQQETIVETDYAALEEQPDVAVPETTKEGNTQMEDDSGNAENLMGQERDVHTAERTNTHATEQTWDMTFTSTPIVEEMAPQTEEISYQSIDTMDLIEQFAENVKVSISEGASSMEMQLNPENLGKVYLQVSSKEGEIRAQIAASDEAVKNALETQVAELRETMHQAGLKVDSIEVTVASHEFERNLEQGQNREFEEGERQQEQQSHRRNINLSSLDELSSLMTEEEALVAQIMKDNGNSVDLTA